MNRKKFIAAVLPLGAAFTSNANTIFTKNISTKIPPYLKKGDTIGITCPAGFITLDDIQPAVKKIQEWGFQIKVGNTVGKRDFTFGGTDAERLQDFQQMMDDNSIKAILCARGGYGAIRMIDQINFTNFIAQPKWIIGFSDITILHAHINKNFGIATLHSKMCNSFPSDWGKAEPIQIETIDSIKKCLVGEKMTYKFIYNDKNKLGVAEGVLIGGNLKTIENLSASKSDINTDGKILFVEDTGEYLYSIDRMFWNLKRSGKLKNLKALIVGGFKIKAAEILDEEFGKNLFDIVLEKTKEYNYPICFDFPVGHQKNNFALKCGVKHKLNISKTDCYLTEI
jgi:muramoyltetrapeptide carboxypeptidase